MCNFSKSWWPPVKQCNPNQVDFSLSLPVLKRNKAWKQNLCLPNFLPGCCTEQVYLFPFDWFENKQDKQIKNALLSQGGPSSQSWLVAVLDQAVCPQKPLLPPHSWIRWWTTLQKQRRACSRPITGPLHSYKPGLSWVLINAKVASWSQEEEKRGSVVGCCHVERHAQAENAASHYRALAFPPFPVSYSSLTHEDELLFLF